MGSWKPDPFELGTDGASTIVVGVDGSPSSLRALAYASGLARRGHTELVAVYVRGRGSPALNWSAGTGADLTGAAAASLLEAQEAVEEQLRAEVASLTTCWGVRVRLVVREGERLKELGVVADQNHADAVIVGASSRLGSRLAGSLAVRLVRQGQWPVTVVP